MQDLSIIIPLGEEESEGQGLVDQLLAVYPEAEILLIGCQTRSQINGGRYLKSPGMGRAEQLNYGASLAKGQWLWFLHADSILLSFDAQYLENQDPLAINYLDLDFDGPWKMKINRLFVRFRSDLFGMPFGDQGFLMTREVWDYLGDYPLNLHYGEDHAFIWEARCKGITLCRLKRKVKTSSRKYIKGGWGRTTRLHLLLSYKQAFKYLPKFILGYPYPPYVSKVNRD